MGFVPHLDAKPAATDQRGGRRRRWLATVSLCRLGKVPRYGPGVIISGGVKPVSQREGDCGCALFDAAVRRGVALGRRSRRPQFSPGTPPGAFRASGASHALLLLQGVRGSLHLWHIEKKQSDNDATTSTAMVKSGGHRAIKLHGGSPTSGRRATLTRPFTRFWLQHYGTTV